MSEIATPGRVLDCTAFSSTFPNPVPREVSRDAILNLVDEFFSSGIQLVTLDGKPDIGKTRIMVQFALRRPSSATTVFIKPNSWFMQEPSLLYADVASQMYWALHNEEMRDLHGANAAAIRQLSFDLQRLAKRTGKLFYFLIDGMEDVADGLSQFAGTLMAVLPLEFPNFRFMITGDAAWVPKNVLSKLARKTYPVPGFSLEEAIAYFEGCDMQRAEIEEIYKSCSRGTPGHLASARRVIDNGMPASKLIEQLPQKVPNPFQIEWQAIEGSTETLFDVLAVLSFDTNPHSFAELAALFGSTAAQIRQDLSACSFVETPSTDDSPVTYVSTSFRRFAAEKLSPRRNEVWERLAEHFLKERNTGRALELLPSYLERAGRPQELLGVLSSTSLVLLVEQTDSFIPLQRQSQIGLDTALKLKRLGEALRFGIQLAAVADISSPRFARAEVTARLAIGDYETALSLAQNAALKHQRLQLLAAIARFQRERGLTPETTVLESLDRLANQINIQEIGDEVVGLASDLMYSRPELAIKLMTSVVPTATSDDRSMDWALAKLSVLASLNRGPESGEIPNTARDLQSRIKDPAARRFSSAISLVVGNYTTPEVLAEIDKLESAGDQIFLLRQWCNHTHTPEKAAEIIDYAVHLAIRTTAYSPTATDFRDLALPLPKIADAERIPGLITAFDIQKESAHRVGPTQDYVQLQLLLAEAEARISQRRAGQRLLETYFDVRNITDLELRVVCTGLLVAASPRIDPDGVFEDSADVRKVSEPEFVEEVRALLRSTADHYVITRRVIEAVATSRPDLAMEIAHELNIQSRRDDALEDVVEHNLNGPIRNKPLQFLQDVLGKFGDPDVEDQVVCHVLARFEEVKPPLLKELAPKIDKYLERACAIINPVTACKALSSAVVILQKTKGAQSRIQQLESALKARWESIDEPGEKLQAGYDIVVALADYAREAAETYLRTTDDLKAEQTGLISPTYINCLRLAIRAFSGLLPRQLQSGADFERLSLQIERVPSRADRAALWSDLALRCFRNERSDDGKHVVNQKIRPLLEKLRELTEFEWREAASFSAPALYETNSAIALDLILTLPAGLRDDALDRVLRFKMRNVVPWDPFKADTECYNLDFPTSLEILKLTEHFDMDVLAYKYIEAVAASAVWRHNRHQIAETQRNEIAQRIRAVARKKFPSPKWIKHEGFAILAEAQALRLLREKVVDWMPLLERARALQNDSDRVFVFAYLAQSMHSGFATERLALLKEAKSVAENIPSTYDRVQRLRLIASVARDIDVVLARSLVVDAMRIVKSADDRDAAETRRELVDFAYQIDPEFASTLASSLDDDAARQAARKRIEYQKLKSGLLDSSDSAGDEPKADEHAYSKVAWELLGYLNAGRAEPREVAQTLRFIRIAGDQSLESAFPILSWVIENAIARRAHADEAKRMVREMFDAAMSASEIAAAVVCRATGKAVTAPAKRGNGDRQRIIIPAEQRGRAIDFLERWLSDNGKEYLKICDPYFGPKDLDVLKIVLSAAHDLRVTIITSLKQQQQEKVELPADEFYKRYWQKHFSDQAPPQTEIVVVGGRAGELPVHDRWWLTDGAGLRLGSSFGGIGKSRDSEISILTDSEVTERSEITDAYIGRQKREHQGEKLTYQFFEM